MLKETLAKFKQKSFFTRADSPLFPASSVLSIVPVMTDWASDYVHPGTEERPIFYVLTVLDKHDLMLGNPRTKNPKIFSSIAAAYRFLTVYLDKHDTFKGHIAVAHWHQAQYESQLNTIGRIANFPKRPQVPAQVVKQAGPLAGLFAR